MIFIVCCLTLTNNVKTWNFDRRIFSIVFGEKIETNNKSHVYLITKYEFFNDTV